MIARMKEAARYAVSGAAPAAWMSPGVTVAPIAPAGTQPRAFDYPIAFNSQTKPRATAAITFETLRQLAETCDILRLVIETRKDQLEALDWQIRPRADTATSPDDFRIKDVQAFFLKPDKRMAWNGWLRALLEDLFVLDAVTIYKRRDRGGRLYSLDLLNGATIAVKLDETGRSPLPPDVAYQQVIKGVAAVGFTSEELIYAIRNPRTDSPYGRSPVEQIISTVNIALKRSASQLAYYTDGNLNAGVFWMDPALTADQMELFQRIWDAQMSGNQVEQRKGKFLPGKSGSFQEIVQPPLKDVYDEWLSRVICFAFSISPQPLISMMNRATADTAHQAALEEGLAPIQRWIKGLLDPIIAEEFGSADLEFVWVDDREMDPEVAAKIQDIKVKNGTLLVNEARAQDGNDPYPDQVGDTPGIITATGFVPFPSKDLLDAQHEATLTGAKNALKAPEEPEDGDPEAEAGNDTEEDDAGGDAATKAARASLKKKYKDPLATAAAKDAITAILSMVEGVFGRAAHHVAAQLRGLHALGKADGDDTPTDDEKAKAGNIADDLNLFEVKDIKTISSPLSGVFADAQAAKLDTIGVDVATGLFGQINTQASQWATGHAADLVTQITDTTRDQLRATIAQGYADGLSIGEIADKIAGSDAFSKARASLIANTETAMASGEGSLAGFHRARDLGIKLQKQWLDDPLACPMCRENAAAGPIGINESFPSGDMTVPCHPRCSCDIIAIIDD